MYFYSIFDIYFNGFYKLFIFQNLIYLLNKKLDRKQDFELILKNFFISLFYLSNFWFYYFTLMFIKYLKLFKNLKSIRFMKDILHGKIG